MTKEIRTRTGEEGTIAVPTPQQRIRAWMQVIVSLLLLCTGILILISPTIILPHNFDESTKKIAAGWVGAVIGYWLS